VSTHSSIGKTGDCPSSDTPTSNPIPTAFIPRVSSASRKVKMTNATRSRK
jgi:hypothetical protein